MFIEGDRGIFDVTPPKGINEASFLIRVKDPARLDFEKVTSKYCKVSYKLNVTASLKKKNFDKINNIYIYWAIKKKKKKKHTHAFES
jgi:hypothetical protein